MPLYAAGVGEALTPFSLAAVIPPLTFSWSVNNKQIVQLKSAFHEVCVAAVLLYFLCGVSIDILVDLLVCEISNIIVNCSRFVCLLTGNNIITIFISTSESVFSSVFQLICWFARFVF